MDKWMWAIFVGVAATAALDLWTLLRKRIFATPLPNYAMVGRWFAHMPRGRFLHAPITASALAAGELSIGWAAHYAIGIAFAAILPAVWGSAWASHPTLWPALVVGIATVAAPLLIMQPAMGTAKALGSSQWRRSAMQSLVTHAVFGFGLYGAAWLARFAGMA